MTDRFDEDDDTTPTGASESGFLKGRLLIAMPTMPDPRFHRSLVYLCEHTADGAMGLIVNRQADTLTMKDLF